MRTFIEHRLGVRCKGGLCHWQQICDSVTARLVAWQLRCECVAKLPMFGHGVQARRQHRKIGWQIEPRTRIPLGSPCALEVDLGTAIRIRLSQGVLAFDEERRAPLPSEREVGLSLGFNSV